MGLDEGGQPTTDDSMTIYCVDAFGEPSGRTKCVAEIQGPDGTVDLKLNEVDDGVFKIQFNVDNLGPGDYVVNVTVDGQPLINAPKFSVNSQDSPHISGPDLVEFIGFAGSPPVTPDEPRVFYSALRSVLSKNL